MEQVSLKHSLMQDRPGGLVRECPQTRVSVVALFFLHEPWYLQSAGHRWSRRWAIGVRTSYGTM
jgi:hypothetical protein